MRNFKAIAAIIPGPALLFVGKWLDLFSRTHLTSPEWEDNAQQLALAVGAFVAVVLSIGLRNAGEVFLKALTWVGFWLTLAGLSACWGIWFYLGPPSPGQHAPANPPMWRDVWYALFVTAMVLLVATITVAGLSVEKKNSRWFWILVAVAVLVLIAIAAYVFWLR
jgi:hypothetical protein